MPTAAAAGPLPTDRAAALKHKAKAATAFGSKDYAAASTLYCQALAALTAPSAAICLSSDEDTSALTVVLHSNVAECALRMANFKSASYHAEQALLVDPTHEKSIRRLDLATEQLSAAQQKEEEEDEESAAGTSGDEEDILKVETFMVRCPRGVRGGHRMYIAFDPEEDLDPDAEVIAQRQEPTTGKGTYFSVPIPEGVEPGEGVEVNILYDGSIIAHPAAVGEPEPQQQ